MSEKQNTLPNSVSQQRLIGRLWPKFVGQRIPASTIFVAGVPNANYHILMICYFWVRACRVILGRLSRKM